MVVKNACRDGYGREHGNRYPPLGEFHHHEADPTYSKGQVDPLPTVTRKKTQALLEASKKPGKRWSIEVQNVKPALFSSYDVGDSVRLVAPSFGWDGFDGFISIEARYYDPTTRECVLVVEEDQTV